MGNSEPFDVNQDTGVPNSILRKHNSVCGEERSLVQEKGLGDERETSLSRLPTRTS